MQILRTVIWVLLLVALLLFSLANWTDVTVKIWEGIVVDTKIPAIVIVSFLIGFVPMWLFYRGTKWRMQRKVSSLETAARTVAVTPVAHGSAHGSAQGGAHDSDRDGVPDRADAHPLTPDGGATAATTRNDGVEGTHVPTRTDRDGDGVPDVVERDPPATGAPGGVAGTYRAPGQ